MDRSGTLSAPILCKNLPLDTKILMTQHAFKVKLQEEQNMDELYVCTADNGSKQVEGIDFDSSYAPTSFFENTRCILAIAADEGMDIYTLYFSNDFQTNIEDKVSDRILITIPPFYLEWYFHLFPADYPLNDCTPADQLCLQNFRTFQGTKDAGRNWVYNTYSPLISISADDIIVAASHRQYFERMQE
eukprot:13756954-Ditylum_brightwellii.AAC.1